MKHGVAQSQEWIIYVFLDTAYAHIPKSERGKFDSKARKCILLEGEKVHFARVWQ